ncbi:RNA dependent RNA polymerase-domain-containing protein [Mycena maculata]|uniref:RNA-dependent RNA polymerase n=1 Tax=Mycena maculata TaxID=230809 RepID=A0AAD7JC57_9AGAR|nr:RNA dependent RNA polymerase-domain-containing protein [Mycena maculata]
MKPPAIIPGPRPLQASSTQSSIESTSSNSLFSAASANSSMSSLGPSAPPSPLKRGAEDVHMSSPSPSKSRRLTPPDASSIFSLSELFAGKYGSALEVHIIEHDPKVLEQFDQVGVHLGVQWELARGVTTGKWTWQQVLAEMAKDKFTFKGPNAHTAGKVPVIMTGRPELECNDLALWDEIDREHATLVEGERHGVGLGPSLSEPGNYYRGQIQYPLRLTKDAAGAYRIYLEKPQKGRSHRFARDLGSPSVLQLSIPLDFVREEGEAVRSFLAKRFVLNGRSYVSIPPKDKSSVYLIQINQDVDRPKPLPFYGDQYRISFEEFVQRHNPPNLNSKQPFAKYTARFALGLSTSIPVLEFERENIFYIPDIVAQGWDPSEKPPAEKIMTDGCGFINRSALLFITKQVPYNSLPTAVQGRIGGAKGLWVLHPTDTDAAPKIWIRDSQLKIKLEGDHRVHRIFDLLRASHPAQTEARYQLSEQSILCLSSNGIPDDVFVELLQKGLEEIVKPLLAWDGQRAMVALWRSINNSGNVSGSRTQRIAGSRSRVLGFRDRDRDEVVDEEEAADIDIDTLAASSRSGRDIGGGPLGLHEKALELIQAGFHPRTSVYLNDKMRYIIKTEIQAVVDKYKISLPESTASDAFVIPDPLGILKENEIYYRTSNPMKNPMTQTFFQVLTGDVILGRYPIRLPCDMQMVTAVNVPELYDWPDVIIASTAGERSLLSLLSGGDYDGDTVIFTWLEPFLRHFKNQPFTPPPDGFLVDYFNQAVKTVDQVGAHLLRRTSAKYRQQTFQEYLLAGLQETKVGQYSWFQDNAIWRHGYHHEQSILMGYIGNTLLDGVKTGLTLKEGIFEEHKKKFGHKRPKNDNWTTRRDDPTQPYVLRSLSSAGQRKGDELLREHDQASGKLAGQYKEIPKDRELLKPYLDAQAKSAGTKDWSKQYKVELEKIQAHVQEVLALYLLYCALPRDDGLKTKRAADLLSLQKKFAEPIPDIQCVGGIVAEEVKASYAYSLTQKEDFGFSVAFRTLCAIKSRAVPDGPAPTSRVFDELKSISGAALRAMQGIDD